MNEAWTERPLGELFEIGAGKTMSAAAPQRRRQDSIPSDIECSLGRDRPVVYRRNVDPSARVARQIIAWGAICWSARAARSGVLRSGAARSNRCPSRITCTGSGQLLRRLSRASTCISCSAPSRNSAFSRGAGNKTTIPNLSLSRLAALEVPQPRIGEQQNIVTALSRVRDAIKKHDQAVALAQELKRAAMRTLFTRGLRGEPQKETEIGPVPESWELTPCEQIFKLTSGKRRPSKLVEHRSDEMPFPVLGGNGVMGFANEWYLDAPKTLIIGRVGEYCGAVHLASGKVWITDNALYVKEWRNDNAELEFVAAFLSYFELNRFSGWPGSRW